MRLCSAPGCGRAIPDGQRFCDECANDPQVAPKRTGWARGQGDEILLLYRLPRWNQGLRPRVLQRYPVCVDCQINSSEVADHEIPARLIVRVCQEEKLFPFDRWGGFYIMANLRGRCHACHNKKGKTEDAKDWTEQLNVVLAPYRRDKRGRTPPGGGSKV